MTSNKTLLVISHTRHYRNKDGIVFGWSSTVRELDELTRIFTKVIHVACLHAGAPPNGFASYTSKNVEFIPIPPHGGSGLKKFSVIYLAPTIIWAVFGQLKRASHFQFRAPTSMGVYLIPMLTFFSTKKGWFKYAGNWIEKSPPMNYAFQRFFLAKLQKRKVTINGQWPHQPEHCISFENPCLTEKEVNNERMFVKGKQFNPPYKICFVGRLVAEKGVGIIMEALRHFKETVLIESVHFAGDSAERAKFEKSAKRIPVKIFFSGFLSRDQTVEVLKASHFLLFPSLSEGFPKVIAEGWNFGCLPIATNISSIPHYVVDNENGFLLDKAELSPDYIRKKLAEIFQKKNLTDIAIRGQRETDKFTYERYVNHLRQILEMEE